MKLNQKIFSLISSITLLLSIPFYLYSQRKEPARYFELENGMKIFLYKKSTLPLINLALAVNVGSKDETEENNGLVHILEHYILFRGTEFRSGSDISRDIRSHGAYFNAHTGRDLAIFEMSLSAEFADFALQNQKEILFNLKFNQQELDNEKKIILEEINLIKDDPFKYAASLAYQNLFQGHPYQKPIYGRKEIIEAATVEQLESFYRNYFVPANCSLAVVGDFNLEEMTKKVKHIFGSIENKEFIPVHLDKVRFLRKSVTIEKEMDVNQAYLVIGMIGPDYNSKDQYAVDILTQILGRGINPMLNYTLRGRRKLVHSISMSFSTLKYGGAILIFLTLDKKTINFAKTETVKFLKMTRRQNYSKEDFLGAERFYVFDFLQSSKNQIRFAYHRSQEKGLSIANSLARFMLLNEEEHRENYLEAIKKINSSDLRKVAAKYLSQGKYVFISILPKREK